MMTVISTASALNLTDWMIGGGFVRNKIWEHLSGNERQIVDTPDIDLVYFEPQGNDWLADRKLSERLKTETGINWQVRNQSYMNDLNKLPPFKSTLDAVSNWEITADAIGVKLDKNNKLQLVAPYGVEDVINFIIRPTPKFKDKVEQINKLVSEKRWREKWPKIKIVI